jgi:hypothetical protein
MRRMLFAVALAGLLLAGVPTPGGRAVSRVQAHTSAPLATADLPAVDPGYIYDQLDYMATHFQRREAGYDNNLPVTTNGHDEFAAYWQQQMLTELAGFGAVARRDPFPIRGWRDRPAVVPAFNVEVTVPGETQAAQIVVIGCHYDAEASSTQSANDDASGCAIELGVARAIATYWRAHHQYPARTLRFVLFDAEEQGIFGSFHYLNATVNGDVGNIVAMFNEEQNGIAYPLRFLGKASNPLLPFDIFLSPLNDNPLYPNQSQLSAAQRAALTHFRAEIAQAVPATFAEFQALGYSTLAYIDQAGHSVTQPVFGPDAVAANVQTHDDDVGSSDQIPFTLAGVPAAMFVGNATYYDGDNPPPWSYPYDQPQDTIALMNTYASGFATESPALELALALPGMLTTWMLAQPDVLGSAAPDGKPIAAISDVGMALAGQPLALDATASFNPGGTGALSYSWSFGDGATASGQSVRHTYAHPGSYVLTLKVSAPGGTRTIRKTIAVTSVSTIYPNPYSQYPPLNGVPPANPLVTLPRPQAAPGTPSTPATPSVPGSSTRVAVIALYAGGAIILLVLLAGVGLLLRRRGR